MDFRKGTVGCEVLEIILPVIAMCKWSILWWNDTDKGKLKYRKKTLSRCHLFRHKSHMHRSGIEPGPPRL